MDDISAQDHVERRRAGVHVAQQQAEAGACLAGQDGEQLALSTAEGVIVGREEQGNLVALGVAVDGLETGLHQVAGRLDHVVAKPLVERCIERMSLLCQLGKPTAVEPDHDRHARQDARIVGAFQRSHPLVEFVEIHSDQSSITNRKSLLVRT